MARPTHPDADELVAIIRDQVTSDPRVLEAMRSVDRARFVPASLRDQAWRDTALPIAADQTISQPSIVAMMTAAATLGRDDVVLEVGTGSGYQAAILARLCRKVVTIERHAELATGAQSALDAMGFTTIEYRFGDGTLGSAADGPFDAIVVTAGAPDVPPALYEQLVEGGRLIIPVGAMHDQWLLRVTRTRGGPKTERLTACRFVKLIGAQGWRE